jgi:hypothetical protein
MQSMSERSYCTVRKCDELERNDGNAICEKVLQRWERKREKESDAAWKDSECNKVRVNVRIDVGCHCPKRSNNEMKADHVLISCIWVQWSQRTIPATARAAFTTATSLFCMSLPLDGRTGSSNGNQGWWWRQYAFARWRWTIILVSSYRVRWWKGLEIAIRR